MAATLEDVIERLRAEGQLTRNTGTNSLKSVSQKFESFRPIFKSIQSNMEMQSKILIETLEGQRRKAELDSLRRPENNNGGQNDGPDDEPRPKKDESTIDWTKLGILGGSFALAVGSTIGLLIGQLDAIKAYFKVFTPNLTQIFDSFKTDISSRFTSLRVSFAEVFDNAIKTIRGMFNVADDSNVGRFMTVFRERLNSLIAPFRTATTTITEIASSATTVSNSFGTIRSFLSSISSTISRLVGIVGKIFAPIAIIITAFDTVRGAIQGYADGGILGGLKGAIDGFFTSLVTVPLDLIKDLVAWVLGKLGFDETAASIKSFSFTKLFKSMTSGIFDFLSGAVDWVVSKFPNPLPALGQLWNGLVGEGGLLDILWSPVSLVIDWVKTLFTDPVAALGQLWRGLVGEGGLLDILWSPVSLVIDWVTKKFGWRDEDAPTFNLLSYLKDVWANVRDTVVEKFQQLADYVSSVPDKVMLFAEGMFVNVSEKLQIGFLTLGNWIASIPARIKLMALNAIRSATSGLPEWAQIVSQSDIAEAEQAVSGRESELEASISTIRASAAESRADIERRMAELNRVDQAAAFGTPPVVIMRGGDTYAPQIQQNNRGGSSVQQNNIGGSGSSDLDYGIPRGPQ